MAELTVTARARSVKERHERELLALKGVQGVGLGRLRGEPAIRVYVTRGAEATVAKIPAYLEGVPVLIMGSGGFNAL